MPRTYIPKKGKDAISVSRENLKAAVTYFREHGGSTKTIAKQFNVLPSSLSYRLKKGEDVVGGGRHRSALV